MAKKAELGEKRVCPECEEVRGSTPLGSTKDLRSNCVFFCLKLAP